MNSIIGHLENLVGASQVLTSYVSSGIAEDVGKIEETKAFAENVEKLIVKAEQAVELLKEMSPQSMIAKAVAPPSAVTLEKSASQVTGKKKFSKPSKGVDEIKTGDLEQFHFKKKGGLPILNFKCVDVKHGTNEAKQNKAWCKTTLQAIHPQQHLDHTFRVIVWDEVQNTEDDGLTNPLKTGEFITLTDRWEVTKIVPKGGKFNKGFDEITIKKG